MTRTSSGRAGSSALGWSVLVMVVATCLFVSMMLGPMYALMGGFWLVCAWALFWVIRLAVRYGVDDALQSNRHWMAAPDRERVSEQ